jgi:hypothetical protein
MKRAGAFTFLAMRALGPGALGFRASGFRGFQLLSFAVVLLFGCLNPRPEELPSDKEPPTTDPSMAPTPSSGSGAPGGGLAGQPANEAEAPASGGDAAAPGTLGGAGTSPTSE